MELEKKLTVRAPIEQVWAMVLDPKVMAGCVPGTQSVEVLGEDLYTAIVQVKISFIAARFKITTRIREKTPPVYLRFDGTGDDTHIGSSLKQSSELFLQDLGEGVTELRIKVHLDVFGKLGSFGLSVMKTKAERLWEEFAERFTATLPSSPAEATDPTHDRAPSASEPGGAIAARAGNGSSVRVEQIDQQDRGRRGWLRRVVEAATGGGDRDAERRRPNDICVEIRRGRSTVRILLPPDAAKEGALLLKEVLDAAEEKPVVETRSFDTGIGYVPMP